MMDDSKHSKDSDRVCETCGAVLVRKPNESHRRFFKREHCDKGCQAIRRCENEKCGAVLVQRAGEARDNFLRRKHCSHECYVEKTHQKSGLCPCHRPLRKREIAEVERRKAEMRARKQAEEAANYPRDEQGRLVAVVEPVDVQVVPVKALVSGSLWGWV